MVVVHLLYKLRAHHDEKHDNHGCQKDYDWCHPANGHRPDHRCYYEERNTTSHGNGIITSRQATCSNTDAIANQSVQVFKRIVETSKELPMNLIAIIDAKSFTVRNRMKLNDDFPNHVQAEMGLPTRSVVHKIELLL